MESAEVTAHLAEDGVWDLVVKKCPYCGKQHTHGGGNRKSPKLGVRLSHCNNGGYELKEKEDVFLS